MRRVPRPLFPAGRHLLGLADMQRDIDRLFEGMLPRPVGGNPMKVTGALWSPATDVCESAEYVVITFDLAHIDRDSIDLSYADNQVTVRGIRRRRLLNEVHCCHRIEIDYGPFERTVHLGSPVNVEEAKAAYEDGFLEVTLPKLQESSRQTVHVNVT